MYDVQGDDYLLLTKICLINEVKNLKTSRFALIVVVERPCLQQKVIYLLLAASPGYSIWASKLAPTFETVCEYSFYFTWFSFFVGEPFYNSEAMYFAPSVDGGVMLKGEFVRFADRDHVYLKISKSDNLHKVHLRDLVVHNIGVRQFLPHSQDEIIFPGERHYSFCGSWINGTSFGVGTIDGYDPSLGWLVKFDYIRKFSLKRTSAFRLFKAS